MYTFKIQLIYCPVYLIKGGIDVWRGEAANAWKAGVNGIYTFNRFDPNDAIFRELGSPETLAGKKQTDKYQPGSAMDYWLKGGKKFLVGK